MPITIIEPQVGQPFGPGFTLEVSTDITEPLPVGWWWRAELYALEELAEWVLRSTKDFVATTDSWPMGFQREGGWTVAQPQARLPQGAAARLVVSLFDELGSAQQTTSVNVQVDYTSGAPWILQANATQSALPEVVRQQIQLTYELNIWGWLGQMLPQALETFLNHPPSLFACFLVPTLQEGEGSLSAPTDPYGTGRPIGFGYQIVEMAPGLGIDEAAVDQVEITALTFALWKRDRAGMEYVSEYIASRSINENHFWGLAADVHRISFYATPGVKFQLCWWALEPQPLPADAAKAH